MENLGIREDKKPFTAVNTPRRMSAASTSLRRGLPNADSLPGRNWLLEDFARGAKGAETGTPCTGSPCLIDKNLLRKVEIYSKKCLRLTRNSIAASVFASCLSNVLERSEYD